MSAELEILSAGAVSPGLTRVLEAFQAHTEKKVTVSFATAPAILDQIGKRNPFHVVIAPAKVLDELTRSGNTSGAERVSVGRIGIGVMVRDRAPAPAIATFEEFKNSLLSADSLVYNQASTGAYIEALFERLGLKEKVKAKSTVYPNFAAVLEHVSEGEGRQIGLGATTVIIENANRGVKFVGPLPAEIQNYTTYDAALVAGCESQEAAQRFIRYITTPAARALFAAAGIQ